MNSLKVSGLNAKLLLVCFTDFEQLESKEYSLDYSKFDVLFEETPEHHIVTFVFHNDGLNMAGGRSKWGRDVKYEITKDKFNIVGRKFFK